ncbi:PAAR domain-containing protein [Pseudomonas sp. 273]|uniref:PAAR domain-containing protein n=1 Tax=Pseudomonas sp. 273 TaxID=75692 RepID=UPI0023D7C117|nr:PAAR domain-containing protein [Pseudomonas sp. 273]
MPQATEVTTQYTNEATAELLQKINTPYFSEADLATFDAQTAEWVRQRQAWEQQHPVIGIYRAATEGSLTRQGGMVQASHNEWTVDVGEEHPLRVARVGDKVVYPDGSHAEILTGSGKENRDVALVGSHLSNGDEIISTRQESLLMIRRQGVSLPTDFLTEREA